MFNPWALVPLPYRIMIIAGALIASHGFVYVKAKGWADAACAAANARATIKQQAKVINDRNGADDFRQTAAERLQGQIAQIEKDRRQANDEVHARPAEKRCPAYTADDIKRLRQQRGLD